MNKEEKLMEYNYIVVEGPIGSGKSKISQKLADFFKASIISEMPQNNPFLVPFYLKGAKGGLAVELQFMLERVEKLKHILEANQESNLIVSDFLFEKDKIFNALTLSKDERELFLKIKAKLMPQFIRPDLLIYLNCSEEVANKRIKDNLGGKNDIFPTGYVKKVYHAYRDFFHTYDEVPILIANTDELDFIGNDKHFEILLETIMNMHGKKYYLNFSESISK